MSKATEPRGSDTHPDNDEDEHDPQDGDNGALEPLFAVLEREAHLAHVAHELGVAGELLAHCRADIGRAEGGVAHAKCC